MPPLVLFESERPVNSDVSILQLWCAGNSQLPVLCCISQASFNGGWSGTEYRAALNTG